MNKPYNKTIENHLFTYQERNILEDDLIEFKECTLLVSTDIFGRGTKFDLIKINYTAIKAMMWMKEDEKDFFDYEIIVGLL